MTAWLAQTGVTQFSADDVLSPYIYVFYVAFLISFIFTPIMRIVASYYGIIDQPDGVRKMHSTPVAYLGGVAVFLGWIAGLAISQFIQLHRQEPGWEYVIVRFSIVAGAIFIVLLGLWDDIHGLRPWVKIVGQILAAALLLRENIGTHITSPLLSPVAARLTNAVVNGADLEGRVEDALPDRAQVLAPAIVEGARQAAGAVSLRIVQSDQFETLWDAANRRAQAAAGVTTAHAPLETGARRC